MTKAIFLTLWTALAALVVIYGEGSPAAYLTGGLCVLGGVLTALVLIEIERDIE